MLSAERLREIEAAMLRGPLGPRDTGELFMAVIDLRSRLKALAEAAAAYKTCHCQDCQDFLENQLASYQKASVQPTHGGSYGKIGSISR